MVKIEALYKITNNINKMYYFGSTKDFIVRENQHIKISRNNTSYKNQIHIDIKNIGIQNFTFEKIFESDDIVEVSRMESKIVREHKEDSMCYNVMLGASGRRVFYESDIIFIRDLYSTKTICIEDAYDKYYKGIVTFRAFKKVWHGDTFKNIHYDAYTKENKKYHFAHGQSRPHEKNGKSKLSLEQVIDIRKRKNNGEDIHNTYLDYKSIINFTGFTSVWKYRTWKDVIV